MIRIEEKIRNIQTANTDRLKKDIRLLELCYESNPIGNKHLLDRIREMRVELEIENTDDIYGWDYFDDVCYLDDVQMESFHKIMNSRFKKYNLRDYPKDDIFQHLNKLAYLFHENDRLTLTQARYNRSRKPKLSKGLLDTLSICTDERMNKELLQLLADTGEDFNIDLLNFDQRIIYATIKPREKPQLLTNKDRQRELKRLYNLEKKSMRDTLKNIRNRHMDTILSELLTKLELPEKIKIT